MKTTRHLPIASLVVAALAFAACGDDDSSADPPTQPPEDSAAEQLADGRYFGFLVADGTAASFDVAELLTGPDADDAAADDGVIPEGGEIENDYYVRNADDRETTVRFGEDVVVRVVDCDAGCGLVRADAGALLARTTPTPVWLAISDGVVVEAEEQYLP